MSEQSSKPDQRQDDSDAAFLEDFVQQVAHGGDGGLRFEEKQRFHAIAARLRATPTEASSERSDAVTDELLRAITEWFDFADASKHHLECATRFPERGVFFRSEHGDEVVALPECDCGLDSLRGRISDFLARRAPTGLRDGGGA